MTVARLPKSDLETIKKHVERHRVTLALIRTDKAPTELDSLLNATARACNLTVVRKQSSPVSDFGFAELNSKDKMLVILWIGGPRTELMSVSETDDEFVHHLEDEVVHSNFYDSVLRHGT
ncbi:MAG TPA: hypothetical protein VJ489_01130 [Thermoplasmata archaeon]|nr:hypothetical protein [Thermoplasmata archaeon]